MSAVIEPLLLDYPRAAAALSLTKSALRDLVYNGKGPDLVKIGARTFFAPDALRAWIDRHRVPAHQYAFRLPAPANTANENQAQDEPEPDGPDSPPPNPPKRRRGRPTKAEALARQKHFERRDS